MINSLIVNEERTAIAIQAGGKSRRMGQDKAFVLLGKRPLVEIVCDLTADLASERMLITNQPDAYAHLGLALFPDLYPNVGPLGGIYTAVSQAAAPRTLVVGVDMPFLQRPFLQYMLALETSADVIVPRWAGRWQPLHAIYSKNCLPAIKMMLETGHLKTFDLFQHVNVHVVEQEVVERFDGNGRSFTNINTPEELTKFNK